MALPSGKPPPTGKDQCKHGGWKSFGGAVAEGSVGMQGGGVFACFATRSAAGETGWRDGRIPDIDEAVDSPQRLSTNSERAALILELVRHVPTVVWGRDELNMWNSNSLTSWLIARSGLDTGHISPPPGGRAPGWHAGLAVAARARGPSMTIRSETACSVSDI